MARQTQVDRAIAEMEREIAILQAALAKLKAAAKPPTRPKLRTTEMPPLQTKETKDA